MKTIERLTITLPPEMAEAVRGAISAGEYASSSEVIREALRDWRHKRALQQRELEELRTRIQRGIDDLDAGRVQDFDPERSIQKGQQRSTPPANSASPTRRKKT
jgi:antitoxin ParD1/3/4